MNSYYTTSSYDISSTSDLAGIAALSAGFIIFTIIISIAAYVFSSICLGRIFKKAGIESWMAWVPFLNVWKLLEMGEQKGAYIFFVLIPGVGALILSIFTLMAIYKINLKFGKSTGYFFLALFLAPVWYAILAFDKSTWGGASAAMPNEATQTEPRYPSYAQPTYQPQPAPATDPQQQAPVYNNVPQQQYQPQPAPVTPVQQPSNDQQQPPQAPTQYFN